MRDRKKLRGSAFNLLALILGGVSLCVGLYGCGSSQPAQPESSPSRYSLTGRVVSIDKTKPEVVIDGKSIPGFMSAMKMPYPVKNPALLDPLSPEDEITADIVVTSNGFWLENIAVVKKQDQAKARAPNDTPLRAPPPPGKQ